ncbi:MAG: hypothetical protein JO250_00410 [Armatimonadetes bacterium]|nr:hypothetical protein [Armatimonadota bacterium]
MALAPGDDLEPLMAGSGLSATQSAVEAARVNAYARDMAAGDWTWLPPNARSPIIVDRAGNIMSGHHRLVAARLAGVDVPEAAVMRFPGVTSRPSRPWDSVAVV